MIQNGKQYNDGKWIVLTSFVEIKVSRTYEGVAARTGTIILVDENRIPHIDHVNVAEENIWDQTRHGRRPCLDPYAVIGADEGAVYDVNAGDQVSVVLPDAADADAVAGTACDLRDSDVPAAGNHGDAVVAGLDDAVGDADVVGWSDLDSVCVGAVVRRRQPYLRNSQTVACKDVEMGVLAVDWSQMSHFRVVHKVKRQCLPSKKYKIIRKIH